MYKIVYDMFQKKKIGEFFYFFAEIFCSQKSENCEKGMFFKGFKKRRTCLVVQKNTSEA